MTPWGIGQHIDRFRASERGAMLVFFAMSCAAIFVVAALSFDLGKRAATQTELQSFADNVALAAAGELDGMPDAILRAETAAQLLIQDEATYGVGDGVLAGAEDFTISFHASLPTNEAAFDAPLSFSEESDRIARFARVQVNPVTVEWSFARILNVFSSVALPSESVVAESTAGYSGMACDVVPVFFCMPPAETGVDTQGIWDPANHIGDSIQLVSTQGAQPNWIPGSLGFLDVTGRVDNAGACSGETGVNLYNCLISVTATRSQCLVNGALRLQDGLPPGTVSNLLFNVRMDEFRSQFGGVRNNPDFMSAPIVTRGVEAGASCGPGNSGATDEAADFPRDDCFEIGTCPASRVGDGDWSEGRLVYVDANYSTDPANIGTVEPGERVTVSGAEYHIDDPFRPGDSSNPRASDYDDFPIVLTGETRWNYYNAEVAAS